MIIPTIIIAFIAAACEAIYHNSLMKEKRQIEILESLVNSLRNENNELRAKIKQSQTGRTMWMFGKETFTIEGYRTLGPEEAVRKALEKTMVESIFEKCPNFIRDFIESGWQYKPDGLIEVWWQFKAQQKLVKDYE